MAGKRPAPRKRPASKPKVESVKDQLNAELEATSEPPVATVPTVDPEVAAMLAAQPKRPARPKTPPPPQDPEVVGSAIANRLLAEEAAARKAMADRRRGVEPVPGAKQPVAATPRRRRDRFEEGKQHVNPGWVSRHVRMVNDLTEKPSMNRVEDFKADGYVPVTDKEGNEIRTEYGLLMQAPPEVYAERVKFHTAEGVQNTDAFANAARAMAESGNSMMGRQVAHITGEGVQEEILVPTG